MTSNEWIIVAWIAMLGGCLGSFLNVVIYRWPAGRSVVSPASACPKCEHAIRWYHNIPVLGWLLLGGRCHDCGARISIRYPLVEAYMALMFLSLAIIYLVAGRSLAEQESIDWLIRAARFGLFALLACVLTCSALMQYDHARVPPALLMWPLLLAVAIPVLLPALREPPLTGLAMPQSQSVWLAVVAAIAITGVRFDRQTARTTLGETALIGALLGLWGLTIVAAAATVAELLWTLLARCLPTIKPLPWSLFLWLAVSVALLSMRRQFDEILPASSVTNYIPWLLLAAVAVVSLSTRPLRAAMNPQPRRNTT
ncbi:MAG: prepilin peptidase [Pirellulales bacterium]